MFTGLIQTVGRIAALKNRRLTVFCRIPKPKLGDSIALNGVCLTVVKRNKKKGLWELQFDLSPETLSRTTFSRARLGQDVNLERCMTLNSFLGGHLVQGHVDGVGRIQSIRKLKNDKEIFISAPSALLRYVVPKGSVTVNGVSLTAVNVRKDSFSVALIPFTLKHTNLGKLKIGDTVNLEADVLAKYVEKFTRKR